MLMWRHRVDQVIAAGLWLTTIVLAFLPILIAFNLGGVHRTTHFHAGLALIASMGFGLLTLMRADTRGSIRQHGLLIPLGLWLGFGFLQTIALPDHVVQRLSPASATAYTDWINPLLHPSNQLTSFPISLARHDSLHACASIGVVIGLTWLSASLFHQRDKMIALLVAVSVCGMIQAVIGVYRLVYPDTTGVTISFGTFFNRNSAALMLNLGTAAGLGILFWKINERQIVRCSQTRALATLRQTWLSGSVFLLGLTATILCGSALLLCGSRGGLLAAGVGTMLAFGWMLRQRGRAFAAALLVFIAIGIGGLLVSLDLSFKSLVRMEGMADRNYAELIDEKRVEHWKDGFRAAVGHLPLGSGLATYAYAHLPFQKDALPSQRWHFHADNLWLDLFTEQGIVGILLAAAVVLISIRGLRRLSRSSDPVDQGLRVAGWYCLGAVGAFMLVDSSLILYANLFVVVVLFSAVVARSSTLQNNAPGGPKVRVTSTGEKSALVVVAIFSTAVVAVSLPRLHQDALVESGVHQIDENIEVAMFDAASIDHYARELSRIAGSDPSSQVLQAQFRLAHQRARLLEVALSPSKTAEQFGQRYLATSPEKRRLEWLSTRPTDTRPPVITDDVYLPAQQIATACLKQLPLSRQVRWSLLYLDFVRRDDQFTVTLLDQLSQLYRLNPARLLQIAKFAADCNQESIAVANCRAAVELDPARADEVIETAYQYARIEILQVLPDRQDITRSAVKAILGKTDGDQTALSVLLKRLSCQDCATQSDRAECEELMGDAAYSLGRYEEAFTHYEEATQRAPFSVKLRIKLIQRLREHGNLQAALDEARKARVAIPREERFTRLVETLGRED